MTSELPVKCPRCGNGDQVRKVSAVVADGTASRPSEYWTGGALSVPYPDVVARTDLARRLRLRPPPAPSTEPGIEIAMGCGAAIGLAIIGAVISVVTRSGTAVNICIWIGLLGAIAWIIYVVRRHNAEKQRVADEMKYWPRVQRLWEDLYYCYHNDVVFLGSSPSKCVSSNDMQELLGKESV